MPDWTDYPWSAFSGGAKSAFWLVMGPGLAMWLGFLVFLLVQGELWFPHIGLILISPVFPIFAVLMLAFSIGQGLATVGALVLLIATVLGFWFREDYRREFFFGIAAVTSLAFVVIGGSRGASDIYVLLMTFVALAMIYLIVRFRGLLFDVVAARLRAAQPTPDEPDITLPERQPADDEDKDEEAGME